ncbi:hypothetical protein G6F60_014610 [Rhizopus arrhizus]|nr:hypothetical protein G6F66_014465 [Rhizopus arrhizus]KAG1386072.1 hypothetical protein G6F60_014610 [Rhizopus arrhizus]
MRKSPASGGRCFASMQRSELPQFREPPHPQSRHGDRAQAADHHRRHGPEQFGRHAGLEFAQLVGRADEQGVHGADPAQHVVRRIQLHQR